MKFEKGRTFSGFNVLIDLDRIEGFTTDDLQQVVESGEAGGSFQHPQCWNRLEVLLPHALEKGMLKAASWILDALWVQRWTGQGEELRQLTISERLALYQLLEH